MCDIGTAVHSTWVALTAITKIWLEKHHLQSNPKSNIWKVLPYQYKHCRGVWLCVTSCRNEETIAILCVVFLWNCVARVPRCSQTPWNIERFINASKYDEAKLATTKKLCLPPSLFSEIFQGQLASLAPKTRMEKKLGGAFLATCPFQSASIVSSLLADLPPPLSKQHE